MKRILTLALLALCLTVPAVAQDIAMERDGSLAAVARGLLADDPVERSTARERLGAEPAAALAIVLEMVEELRVERAAAAPVPLVPLAGERGARPDPSGTVPYLQLYDVRDLLGARGGGPELLERFSEIGDGATIRFANEENGVLLVLGTGSVHEAVQGTLDGLRTDLQPMVLLETRFLDADRMQDLGLDLAGVRPGEVVLSSGVMERVAEWVVAGRIDVLSAPSVVTTLGQSANVTLGRELSFVADFEVEVSQDTFIADPVIETVFAGTTLDLDVAASTDGRYRVYVDHHTADVREPMEAIAVDVGHGPPVKVQAPDVYETRVHRALEMSDGQAVLLALPGPPDAVRLLMLSIQSVDLSEK